MMTKFALAQTGTPTVMFDPISVGTIAGSGASGHLDGIGTGAQFYSPGTITKDAAGNLYVTGFYNHSMRRITPTGVVTTIAGGGDPGLTDGSGSAAQYNGPIDAETDAAGNVYNVDIYNVSIRKTTPDGIVSTVYHNTVAPYITSIAVGVGDTIYYCYQEPSAFSSIIFKIAPVTGTRTVEFDGGDYRSTGIHINKFAVDAQGNFYFANSIFNKIQKLSYSGVLTTIGGTGASGTAGDGGLAILADIGNPRDIDVDSLGNVYISTSDRIRKISPAGIITTIAGSGPGFADAVGTNAAFGSPEGIKVNADGNIIYVADGGNHRIRKMSVPVLNAFITASGTPSPTQFFDVSGIYLSGNATVTAPAGYEISLSAGSGYASSIDLSPINFSGSGFVTSTKIYIRLAAATAAGTYNGDITITAAGATTATLPVTGTVLAYFPASALDFSASNYITIPTATNIPTGNSNYTVETWIKLAPFSPFGTPPDRNIIEWGNTASLDQATGIRVNSFRNILHYWGGTNNHVSTSFGVNQITDGNWHHIAVTYDGASRKIYFDGQLYGQDNRSNHNVPTANNLRIGYVGGPQPNAMQLDELRIYNRALCEGEIQSSMNCEERTTGNGLVANYHFNWGFENTNNSFFNTLPDESGNGNNGVMTGFTFTGTTDNWVNPGAVTTGNACSAFTGSLTPGVSISRSGANNQLCTGQQATYNATTSNAGTAPIYQWKVNDVNQGTNSPTFVYTAGATAVTDNIKCVVTPGGDTYCIINTTATSNALQVSTFETPTWYLDADGDNYYTGSPVVSCNYPGSGYTTLTIGPGDCDDSNPAIHPYATEVQGNNIDDNCDGETDELPYCVPAIAFRCDFDGINEVVLGSITNNTNGAPCINGYSNYTLSHSTSNAAGNAVNFSIALRGFSLQQVNVYVDYTNDGDFDDAGEAVAVGVEGFEGAPATGSFVIPALQPVGNYRVRVISSSSFQFTLDACNSNSGEAEDYRLTVTPYVKPPYCTPVVDFPCVYTWMENVTLGTIVNTNSSCTGGYSDFSSLSTDVLPGGNVDFSINCFGGVNQYANIFVDFTDDGDFDDAGEQVVTDFFIAANTTANGLFAVPAPLPGGNYRMRIVMDAEGNPSPTACHSSVGEAEDYTLHVLPVYCTPVIDNPCSNSYISNVTIGNINNSSTCNGYDDYSTTQSTTAAQGASVNYSISSAFFNNQLVNIYVDYNADADFGDAGEEVAAGIFMDQFNNAVGSFTVPLLQTPGSYRLRVVSDLSGNTPDACHSFFGEVEDYTLIVEQACLVNTWTSAANDGDWNNPANWCSGIVPTGSGNAKIPAANTPYPSLTADAAVNNIVIESGATLSIGAHTLTLNGTVNEATFGAGGTISGSDQSSLIALNSAATYIYFTPGQNVLKNLTLGYAAQLLVYGGDLEITANPLPGKVTLGQYSNFYCSNLIFKSGPAGTARLDELPVDGSGNAEVQIQGSQTVERYVPNNGFRSWRLLSVPTHSSGQTIRQAWQEGDANPLPQQNYLPGYGTQITGTGNRTAAQAAGFDNVAANAAMLYWNVNAWSPVTNTNTAIDNKQAYFLYIRGERSKGVSGSVTNSSSTTLRTAGSLYTGDQSTTVQANSFTLVPNLYASGIDFTGLTRTGVSNLFYIWDSKKLSGSSLGVYQTFSATNSFNCMVSGGSYVLGQPVTLIESGQAFFVQGNSTGGSIVLHESSKRNGSTGLGFRPSPAAVSKIETRLYEADGTTMRDAASIVFDNAYSNAVEEEDAPKIGNPGENFAIETSSKILAVEGRKPISDNDLIQFRMWNLKKQQYLLELAPQLLAGKGLEAYLEDDYLKTSVSLDLDKNNSIPFSADANAGSSAANRFRIVFKKASQSTDEVKPRFVIAPNPVESGSMHLQFKNQPAGTYYVRLINTAGQIVFAGAITHTGGSVTHKVVVPEAITNGHYKAAIHQPGKATETLQVLLNRK